MTDSRGHVLIAANPKSGASSKTGLVADLDAALTLQHFTSQIITDLQLLETRSRQLAAQGQLRAVVSAGGDGTVSAIANFLSPETPILVFPLGTENLLAKHLGLAGTVESAVQALLANQQVTIDVGLANDRIFLIMLSVGFDAEVVRQMTAIRTGHINRWMYARPIAHAMWRYRFPQLQYRAVGTAESGTEISGSAAWLFLFNVPRYAAALKFCPQADPSDGQLDLCTFSQAGVSWGLGYLSRLWLGSHQRMRGFKHQRCSQVEIQAIGPDGQAVEDVPYQVDGDLGGVLPLRIEVVPDRLRLIVGAAEGEAITSKPN